MTRTRVCAVYFWLIGFLCNLKASISEPRIQSTPFHTDEETNYTLITCHHPKCEQGRNSFPTSFSVFGLLFSKLIIHYVTYLPNCKSGYFIPTLDIPLLFISEANVLGAQSCLTPWAIACQAPLSKEFSRQGSSVQRILQTRIMEWEAIPFSRGSTQGLNLDLLPCFTIWATKKALQGTANYIQVEQQPSPTASDVISGMKSVYSKKTKFITNITEE